jgi:hypothetical protein
LVEICRKEQGLVGLLSKGLEANKKRGVLL